MKSNGVLLLLQLLKKGIASSSDEIMFALTARQFGYMAAACPATRLYWKCQRPLPAFRAAMNKPGKDYTKWADRSAESLFDSAACDLRDY